MSIRPKAMPPRDETPVERHLREREETINGAKAVALLFLLAVCFGGLLSVVHPLTQLVVLVLS